MAALSGRKYSPCRMRGLFPEYSNLDTTDNGTVQLGNARSIGKKYQPVKISTAYFDNPPSTVNPSSSRKTMGRSAQKLPIRNIHKLLESPKRNARKRLDNLYDCSKPKKTLNPPTVGKVQALSAKKPAPKPAAVVATSESKKSRTGPIKQPGENKRQSRILPPGTITGAYVDRRSSLAQRNLFYKPINSRFTLNVKKSGSKRPSDVAEESPQAFETSSNSAEEPGRLPGLSIAAKTDIQEEKTVLRNYQDEKEASPLCSRCSRFLDESANTSVFFDDKVIEKSKENSDPNLQGLNRRDEALERPTVIVTRPTEDHLESAQVVPQDGSYSEILSLQQRVPRGSSETDESVVFKQTEIQLNGDKTTEYVFEMIKSSKEMLIRHKSNVEISISQHEEQLASLRRMLSDVNTQLEKQSTLESDMKPKGWCNLDKDKLSLLVCEGIEADSKDVEDSELNKPEAAKPKKNRKSTAKLETKGKKGVDDSGKDLSIESKRVENEIENIENEPPQRRRSARLAMKQGDVSLPVQHSTPVTGKKVANASMAKSKPCTPSLNTPARNGKWGRRSERPLREYMVLKSAIKFLNTPDSRRYKIGSDEKVKVLESIDHEDQEVQITDKLLRELHELYSTP